MWSEANTPHGNTVKKWILETSILTSLAHREYKSIIMKIVATFLKFNNIRQVHYDAKDLYSHVYTQLYIKGPDSMIRLYMSVMEY